MTARKGRSGARPRSRRADAASRRRAAGLPGPGPTQPRDERGEREHVEDLLDEALMQTFPASDPITLKACGTSTDPASAGVDPVPRGTGANDGHAGEDPRLPETTSDDRPPPVSGGH